MQQAKGKLTSRAQQPSDYNLLQGESHESTTAYGLHFLETIRRTKDKRCVDPGLFHPYSSKVAC